VSNGFIPNLPIGGCQQTYLGDVNRLIAGLAQGSSQQRRKLGVNQKKQDLLRRNNGVVRLACSKSQNCIDIGVFQIRIFLKNRLSRLTR